MVSDSLKTVLKTISRWYLKVFLAVASMSSVVVAERHGIAAVFAVDYLTAILGASGIFTLYLVLAAALFIYAIGQCISDEVVEAVDELDIPEDAK